MIFNQLLEYCMKKSKLIILITVIIVISAALIYPKLNKVFLPTVTQQAIKVILVSPTKNTEQMTDMITNDYLPIINKDSLLKTGDKRILITNGTATVYFYFNKMKNIDAPLEEIRWVTQQYILNNNSVVNKVNIELISPTLNHIVIDLYGDAPYSKLKEIAKTYFVNYFKTQDYCKKANIESNFMPAVNIKLNMKKLAEYRLSSLQVTNAVSKNISNGPIILTSTSEKFESIQLDNTDTGINSIKNMIVKYSDNTTPIFLKDLATISVNDLNYHLLKKLNNQNLIQVKLSLQNNINQLQYEPKVYSYYQSVKNRLSSDKSIKMKYQKSILNDLTQRTNSLYICISISFIFIIIFLFLSHPNLAFVISASTAIPLSISIYTLYLYTFGIPLDTIGLSAICIGIGFLIDDSILVKEKIMQNLHDEPNTDNLKKAIIKATSSVLKPVIYTSVIMLLIFIVATNTAKNPSIKELLTSYSTASIVLIIVSTLDALIITPVLLRFLLSRTKNSFNIIHNPFSKYFQISLSTLKNIYSRNILFFANKLPSLIISIFIISFLCVFISYKINKSFLPPLEFTKNTYIISITPKDDSDSKSLLNKSTMITQNILNQRGVIEVLTSTYRGLNNLGFIKLIVRLENNNHHIDTIIKNSIPSSSYTVTLQKYRAINNFNRFPGTNTPLSFVLYGKDLTVLKQQANNLKSLLMKSYPIAVSTSFDDDVLTPTIKIDENKAMEYGISNKILTAELQTILSPLNIGSISIDNKKHSVIVATDYNRNIQHSFSKIVIPNINYSLVNLDKFSSLQQAITSNSLFYMGRKLAVHFYAEPNVDSVSISDITHSINQFLRDNRQSELTVSYLGQSDQYKKLIELTKKIIVTISFIFFILSAFVLRSLILSLASIIIFPTAYLGAILMLYFFNLPYNVYSSLGLFVISSVAVKSFLVIFDKINTDLMNYNTIDDKTLKQSIINSCLDRFRPILLTSLTLILSSLALIINIGFNNSSYYSSLSLVIIGGSISSTILSYYFLPSLYYYLFRLQRFINTVFLK